MEIVALAVFLLYHLWISPCSSSSIPPIHHLHLSNSTDEAALLSFKSYITYDPSNALANWDTGSNFCSWRGVSCSRRRQRVTALVLHGYALQGTLDPHIGNLSFLRFLNLSENNFHGTLPNEFGFLRRLKRVYLYGNQLQGTVPPSLGDCQQLELLSLAENHLSGAVPKELVGLPNLKALLLGWNYLTGTIPPSIGNLSMAEKIDFGNNSLYGNIPNELGALVNLKYLWLSENSLAGSIPHSIFNISTLKLFDAAQNNLSGELPVDLGKNLPNLDRIFLWGNTLTGRLPASISNSSKITALELSHNSFYGPIPREFGRLPLLELLHLGFNNLSLEPESTELSIITSLTNCTFLRTLVLAANPFGGVLPSSIGKLSTQLEILDLQGCQAQGSIPRDIGNLTSLLYLYMDYNYLTGPIPPETGMLANLQKLFLTNNRLEGPIPAELFMLRSVGEFYLENNTLSGSIDNSIQNVTHLYKISLSFNKLSSIIPPGFWNLKGLLFVDMSNNNLSGLLSPEVGNLKALDWIDLSANQMSGNIPTALGNLQMLRYLNLSRNSFQGHIPETLGKLLGIETMDLSSNLLAGTIPNSLANLTELKSLNLSFNQLEGQIPDGGVFANLTKNSFLGNKGLCGAPRFLVSICPSVFTKGNKKRFLTGLIVTCAVVALLFFLVCLFTTMMHRKKREGSHALADDHMPGEHRRISYYELVSATNNFSEANLLGVGSFGSVYRGNMTDGTGVAVKVLNLQSEGASRSFDAECQVLCRIRHRNLVKIISACCNPDFKALVLQFMSQGSLDQWLHSDNNSLDLHQRLDIMIDVGSALEYLHHGYSESIIHCDLKPSNILLDNDKTAHVGDFGLAKILIEDKSWTRTATMGTIGYIAPEYGSAGHVTTKVDVYSYGILLLETFTGRKPTDAIFTGDFNLRNWVENSFPNALMDVVEGGLWEVQGMFHGVNERDRVTSSRHELLCSIIEVGLLCSSESPGERMSMRDVVAKLKKIKSKLNATVGRT